MIGKKREIKVRRREGTCKTRSARTRRCISTSSHPRDLSERAPPSSICVVSVCVLSFSLGLVFKLTSVSN